MRRHPSHVLVVAALLYGCGSTEHSIPAVEASSTPSPHSCKPEAPVSVQLAARPLASGAYEITMTATPTRSTPTVELALLAPGGGNIAAPHASFGVTPAGVTRSLTTTIDPSGVLRAPAKPGLAIATRAQIHAVAKVPVDGIAMTRTASITLGPPAPAPKTRTYALPDGDRAKELRP